MVVERKGSGCREWGFVYHRFLLQCSSAVTHGFGNLHIPTSQAKIMKLLNTYEDRDEAEEAAAKLTGDKRLASERDATVVIYNLFGIPSWGNFHRLGMYDLIELKDLLDSRAKWQQPDRARHGEIIATLKTVAKNYGIQVPQHWL